MTPPDTLDASVAALTGSDSKSIGPVDLSWSVSGSNLSVHLHCSKVDFSTSFTLSIKQPSASFESPKVLDFQLKGSVSFSDDNGELTLDAELVTPPHVPNINAKGSVPALPPFILGVVAAGASFPQVLAYAPQIFSARLDFATCQQIASAFGSACSSAGIQTSALVASFRAFPDFYTSLYKQLLAADLSAARGALSLAPGVLESALQAVVADPTVQSLLPGIAGHFPSTGDARAVATAGAPGVSASAVIAAIAGVLGTNAAILALGSAALAGLAFVLSIFLTIVLVGAGTMTVGAWVLAVAAILVALASAVVVAIAAVLLFIALVIGGILTIVQIVS